MEEEEEEEEEADPEEQIRSLQAHGVQIQSKVDPKVRLGSLRPSHSNSLWIQSRYLACCEIALEDNALLLDHVALLDS